MNVPQFDATLLDVLACPHDHLPLRLENGTVLCEENHRFCIENGIPIFAANPRREAVPHNMPPLSVRSGEQAQNEIDPFVSDWIVNTNGKLYWRTRGRLPRYPIPDWSFASARGEHKVLVDVGCSWGRWSMAASRAGFRAVGIDVHVDALAAAYRVSRQLRAPGEFLCADAEPLPFRTSSVDCVFSYSVLQHLEKVKATQIFREAARILKPDGILLVQLPNSRGLASIVQQAKRGFREARVGTFEMRYWSRMEIRSAMRAAGFEGVDIRADGFFTQNAQLADLDLLSAAGKMIVLVSYAGRFVAKILPPLTCLADSLWIEARRQKIPE